MTDKQPYAELPADRYSKSGNVTDTGWFSVHDMRAFADATHAQSVESLAAAYREELDKLSQRNYELRQALTASQADSVQEPWGACVEGRVFVGNLPEHVRKLAEEHGWAIRWLYTAQPAPQQEVQEHVRTSGRTCYLCGHPAELHPMEPDPRGGMRRGSCPMTAVWSAPQQEVQEPFGYVNTHTGQFLKDVEACRKNNEGHWRTVYTAQPAPSGDAELLDFICNHDRLRMVEQSGGFWRVYQDESPWEAEHHLWQSMTRRWYPTAREAIKAARDKLEAIESAQPQPDPFAAQPAPSGDAEDTAMLDWLDQNIFHREMSEWDAKYGGRGDQNMWVLFAPKGVQGTARNIINAARKEGKP